MRNCGSIATLMKRKSSWVCDFNIFFYSQVVSFFSTVLGAENNTVSYMRNRTGIMESTKVETVNLLSPDDATEVILVMTRHIFGRIRINVIIQDDGGRYVLKTKLSNKGNFDNRAFLISFRTTRNNTVRWLYDCPIANRGVQDFDFRSVSYPEGFE